jgi:hypothetical protein
MGLLGLAVKGASLLGTAALVPGALDFYDSQSDAGKTLDREGSRYVPNEGVERNAMQSLGDFVFQRGDDIQAEGKERRRKKIASTKEGQLLDDAGQEYSADTTDEELAKRGRALKIKEAYVNRILEAGGVQPKAELYALDTATLGSKANTAERDKANTDYRSSQAYKDQQTRQGIIDTRYADDKAEANKRYYAQSRRQDALDRDRIAERKEGRLDRIDQRMSDREVRMLELGMKERMFDKRLQADARTAKRERMAAIIAGLTNLTGAFAI